MKKTLLFSFLIGLSLPSFAATGMMNVPSCMSISKGNATICFKNETGVSLEKYELLETLVYEDGAAEKSISNLAALQNGNFSVMTISSDDLKKDKIASVSYSIVKGDAIAADTMPGCTIEVTPNSISKLMLSIHKRPNNYVTCN